MTSDMQSTEVAPSTKQDGEILRQEGGRFAPGNNANPTGKGGFGERPEHRNSGRWDKETSISWWYNKILRMTDEEYDAFKPDSRSQRIALSRITEAEGTGELALKSTKEITDRTEGRPRQDIDMNIDGEESVPIIRGFVIPTAPEDFIDDNGYSNNSVAW